MWSRVSAHHESRDVCLRGVGGQVHLLSGATLVFGIHHHAVAGEALQTSQPVLQCRDVPAHGEGGGANLGDLEVCGRRDG